MNIIRAMFRVCIALANNNISICLCIFFLSVCNSQFSYAEQAKPQPNDSAKVTSKKGSRLDIADSGKWWQISAQADKLIDERKYSEAEKILFGILPQAKKEGPQSLDYALTLCRLSTDLYALKKYPQALNYMQDAIDVLNHREFSINQHQIMWRCMGTQVAIFLAMQKNAEAEALARKTIAYSIAFPGIASARQIKIVYGFLSNSLEAQKKFEEANKIREMAK